jgi:hypothetical protein
MKKKFKATVCFSGLLGTPTSPVHTMRETDPRLVDASVQADDANLQMVN